MKLNPAASDWLDQVAWNADGLVPAIAQDDKSGDILMMAWMNRTALAFTAERGQAVYWSRSRQKLWHKGETSGHMQQVSAIRLDCDADVIVLKVHQVGGIACHTGVHIAFFGNYRTKVGKMSIRCSKIRAKFIRKSHNTPAR